MKTINAKQIVAIADLHVEKFRRMLDAASRGSPAIRADECRHYLNVWSSIVRKHGQNLTPTEASEVRDAIDSEEFDDVLADPAYAD